MQKDMTAEPVTLGAMAALSAPAVPMFALMMPLVIFVPPYFAEHMGLGLAAVGTIFTLGRLFDVVTDPFAGIVMDRTRQRVPKRLWVVAGAMPLALATWQIFFVSPPVQAGTLMAWLIVLYAGWTLMSVGLYSWASEVSSDYHERSRVMGAVQMANSTGTILVLLIPAAVEAFASPADVDTLRIRAMGAAILLMLPVSLLVAWLYAPRAAHGTPVAEPLLPALKQALHNASLRRLIGADFAIGLNIGVFTALSVFFSEIVLGLEGRAGTLQLVLLSASLAGLPVFVRLAGRLEKHNALALTALVTIAGGLAACVLPAGSFALALACYVLFGIASGAAQMLPRAIMADVLDEASLATGTDSTGLYFSFLTTTLKLGLGLGVGLTYALAELGGFDPATARSDASAHWVIRAMLGGIPMLLGLLTISLMWRFPLGRSRHDRVREALGRAGDSG